MNPFRRAPVDARKPLMPGRKTRWRMFRLHFYLGFLVIVGWGVVWSMLVLWFGDAIWRPYHFTRYWQWFNTHGLGFLAELPLAELALRIRKPFRMSVWFLYSELPIGILLVLCSLLPIFAVSSLFALICYRRAKLSLRPFLILLILLMANSLVMTYKTHRQAAASNLNELWILSVEAQDASRRQNHKLAEHLGKRARELIQDGADVNASMFGSSAPLQQFARVGDAQTMKLLLEHGASITSGTTLYSQSTIGAAMRSEKAEAVAVLLDFNADIGEAIAFIGFGPEDTRMVKMLVERGADVNQKGYETTPLEGAVRTGNRPVARYLIEQGADTSVLSALLEDQDADEDTLILWTRSIQALTAAEEIPEATSAQ